MWHVIGVVVLIAIGTANLAIVVRGALTIRKWNKVERQQRELERARRQEWAGRW